MIVKKYLHSCIVIEENDKRLLIDPGNYSFIEGILKPEDIGAVDAILLTHEHLDHYDPRTVKTIASMKSTTIVTHKTIGKLLNQDGLNFEEIKAGKTIKIAGFTLTAFEAPHEPLPATVPHNLAYLINDRLLHPGDSYNVQNVSHCEVLALPISAPWGRTVDAVKFAKALSPKKIIPIHDAFLKDFARIRMYKMFQNIFTSDYMDFLPLELGEELKLS